jgi:hypothetical protein
MNRTLLVTLLSAAGVAVAGSAALAANTGILDSVGSDVGTLSVPAVDATEAATTAAAPTTASTPGTAVFELAGIGTLTVGTDPLDLLGSNLGEGWAASVDGTVPGFAVLLTRGDERVRFRLDDASGALVPTVERLDDVVITAAPAATPVAGVAGDPMAPASGGAVGTPTALTTPAGVNPAPSVTAPHGDDSDDDQGSEDDDQQGYEDDDQGYEDHDENSGSKGSDDHADDQGSEDHDDD